MFHSKAFRRTSATTVLVLLLAATQQANAQSTESVPEETASGSASASAAPDATGDTGASDEPSNCADAYEQAQTEKVKLKYKHARELAQLCSRLECSVPAITEECVKLDEQLERDIPTLVFSAKKWDGTALVDVKVDLDGQPLLDHLDGTPVSLDPGTYEFRFETPGFDPVTARHVAHVGDTNRLIEVVFGEAPPEAPLPPASNTDGAYRAEPSRSIPSASYVLAGTSVLAFGAFGYLRLSGIQDYNRLNDDCSPRCEEGEVDDIRAKFRLSYLPLGIGVAAFAGAVAVYYFGNTSSEPQAEVSVAPIDRGAGAQLRARF